MLQKLSQTLTLQILTLASPPSPHDVGHAFFSVPTTLESPILLLFKLYHTYVPNPLFTKINLLCEYNAIEKQHSNEKANITAIVRNTECKKDNTKCS